MNDVDTGARVRGDRLSMPRSRGALVGFLLILLGLWGALIPFLGPYFNFAYTPDVAWTWTNARGWLEVLPGAATVLGGLLLLGSNNRATAMLGGWLAVLAGAWFVVGPLFAASLGIVGPGAPVAAATWKVAVLEVAYFYGLGVVVVFLGAIALGRLSVRTLRDIQYARRPVAAAERREPVTAAEPDRGQVPVESREPVTERVATPAEEAPRRGLFGRRRRTTTPVR